MPSDMQTSLYQRFVFPALSKIDPESSHNLTIRALARAQVSSVGQAALDRIAGDIPERPVSAFGLRFPNELGVAAGFDKNAQVLPGLFRLGFGHIEVGTLTPEPQEGNARPRVFRLREDSALINRMGFPNQGATGAAERLKRYNSLRDGCVVGVSLGKQKTTTLERAARDYLSVMRVVYPHSDYLAINVSSPNTPGLRDLQGKHYLTQLLLVLTEGNAALAAEHGISPRPMILKISPDLTMAQLDSILEIALERGISGIAATNTTTSRANLKSKNRGEMGGLSGKPLASRSNVVIAHIRRQVGGRLPIIGAGGVSSAADVREKLAAGATLVQIYTGLVYEGPGLAGRILRRL